MHDAEEYTLSIRKECVEGDTLYVARVEEMPDIEEYADSYDFARELALDAIRTTQSIFQQQGKSLPSPKAFNTDLPSGRVTLRLSKSSHAKAIYLAEMDGVSLNSYICSCVEAGNTSSEIGKFFGELRQVKNILNDISDRQSKNLTQITKMVSSHAVTMSSKFRSEVDENFFTALDGSRKLLVKQDFKYKYDQLN